MSPTNCVIPDAGVIKARTDHMVEIWNAIGPFVLRAEEKIAEAIVAQSSAGQYSCFVRLFQDKMPDEFEEIRMRVAADLERRGYDSLIDEVYVADERRELSGATKVSITPSYLIAKVHWEKATCRE